jgi:hypothetical protein
MVNSFSPLFLLILVLFFITDLLWPVDREDLSQTAVDGSLDSIHCGLCSPGHCSIEQLRLDYGEEDEHHCLPFWSPDVAK